MSPVQWTDLLTGQRYVMNTRAILPCVQIAVIASRSLERAKEFAGKHGIPKAYGGYEELASDPDVGEFTARDSPLAQAEIMASWCYWLEHLWPCRRCVPGSVAHGALASWTAVPQRGKERAV